MPEITAKECILFPLIPINDVTHVIQLAVAPVFLLTAVGTFIAVLTNRLSRIVDRSRALEENASLRDSFDDDDKKRELAVLARRLRLIYLAVTCEVFCGLFVGLIIAIAFVDAFVVTNLSGLIAGVFIFAMIAFIGGLVVFLREIFLAVSTTRSKIR